MKSFAKRSAFSGNLKRRQTFDGMAEERNNRNSFRLPLPPQNDIGINDVGSKGLFTYSDLVTVTFKFYNCANGDGKSDGQNGFHTCSSDGPSKSSKEPLNGDGTYKQALRDFDDTEPLGLGFGVCTFFFLSTISMCSQVVKAVMCLR